MKIGTKGTKLIQDFEGCELEAYVCPAGVLTIGYGHTGPDVKVGQRLTQNGATHLLLRDLARFERGVAAKVKVPLSQDQFDACVSFAFNLGLGAFGSSTLLKRINANRLSEVPAQFLRWNKARVKGKLVVLRGLTKRRKAEAALFA